MDGEISGTMDGQHPGTCIQHIRCFYLNVGRFLHDRWILGYDLGCVLYDPGCF